MQPSIDNISDNKEEKKCHQKRKTYTNKCCFWQTNEVCAKQNGYWNVSKLRLSNNMKRIGVVFISKNSRYKILIIETKMSSSDQIIWTNEGRITSKQHIEFNAEITICVVLHSCNDIDLFRIKKAQNISKQNISMNDKFNYMKPDIALLKVFGNNNLVIITKQRRIYQQSLNGQNESMQQREILIHRQFKTINKISGNGSKYIVVPQSLSNHKMFIHDAWGHTNYEIKNALNALLKGKEIETLISNQKMSKMIIKTSENQMYFSQIHKKTVSKTASNDFGSDFFDVSMNVSAETYLYESSLVFEEQMSEQMEIDCFYEDDVLIGHNEHCLIMWKICNLLETKEVILRTASMQFDGLICRIISEFVGVIPQKMMINFVDFKKREFVIDAVDGMNGLILLRNDEIDSALMFKLDYSLILNQANKSKCFHSFSIALPLLS